MKTGNPILDKNLECIKKYNPDLVQKLLNIKALKNDIQIIETELSEPNILYNGLALHSQQGADLEVENAFQNVCNTKNSRHIIFGIGLGYLFQSCCEKSKGIVFLYEPNLEILRVTLEIVDFSEVLSKNNVFVCSSLDFFAELYAKTSPYKANTGFFVLNSYKNILYKDEIGAIQEKIKDIILTENGKIEGAKRRIKLLAQSVVKNLPPTSDAIPIDELGELYKDKTAVIISAGPSLDENIQIIKENRDKFVVFCIGQAIRALDNAEIKPDFLVMLEFKDCSGQVNGIDLSDINLIIAPYTHSNTYLLKPKKTFLFIDKSEVNNLWQSFFNGNIPIHEAQGTVSYMAIECARILGCKKLIIIGMDLAILDNKCYGENTAYSNIIVEQNSQNNELKLKFKDENAHLYSLNSEVSDTKQHTAKNIKGDLIYKQKLFTYAKGISGDMIPTFENYALFVEYFQDFAKQNPELNLINTSLRGLQIDGFKNMTLSEALIGETAENIVDAADVSSGFKFNKQNAVKNAQKIKSSLGINLLALAKGENVINEYEQNNQNVSFQKLDEEIKKIYELSVRVPQMEGTLEAYEMLIKAKYPEYLKSLDEKAEIIKAVLPIYKNLNNKNEYLFKAISYKDNLEINFITENVSGQGFSNIILTYSALKDYFTNVNKTCKETIDLLSESENGLNQQ